MSNDALKQEFLSKHNYKDSRNVKIKDTLELYKSNKYQKYLGNARFKSYTESLSFSGKAIVTGINFVSNLTNEAYRSFDSRIDAYEKELDNPDLTNDQRIEIKQIQDNIHREKIAFIERTRKEILNYIVNIGEITLAVGGVAAIVTKVSDKTLQNELENDSESIDSLNDNIN